MKKVKVGYLSLVKGSWINDKLAGQRTDALNMLNSLDIELADCGGLIQNEAQAAEAIEKFADVKVDCLVVHFLTFALGACAPSAAKKLGVPVIFWSVPEPPMQGGRLQANSFCAINMNWRFARNSGSKPKKSPCWRLWIGRRRFSKVLQSPFVKRRIKSGLRISPVRSTGS